MNNFLKENLPESYVLSKEIKGEYKCLQDGIIKFVRLEKSDFLDGKDKWVYILTVAAHDKYSCHNSDSVANIIFEVSILDNQIVLLDRWDQITHWELDDKKGLKNTLDNIVLPWLDWITQPSKLIDYLIRLEKLEPNSLSSAAINKFGSVLADKLYLTPPRVRKSFNGIIASLYKDLGNKELAKVHLKKHREFIIADHKPTQVKSFNESFEANMKLIDEGLVELESGGGRCPGIKIKGQPS